MYIDYKTKKRINNIIFQIFVGGFCFIMLYPLLWMLSGTLKTSANAMSATLIPDGFNIRNFADGWRGFGGTSFAVFF
ncbi:MAG: carbohydrate ABC transporter permease, partial [bacterium]